MAFGNRIKVLIAEKNLIDLEYQEEYEIQSNDIPFSDPLFIVNNVGDGIREAKQNAEGFPRAGIALIANGVVSNNQWVSYSELLPNVQIVFPVNTKLNELTWANTNTNVSFDLKFYKNGILDANLFYTYQVRNGTTYGFQSGLNFTFNAGDWIRIKYIDQGTNVNDFALVLWISRIP